MYRVAMRLRAYIILKQLTLAHRAASTDVSLDMRTERGENKRCIANNSPFTTCIFLRKQ